MRKGEVRKQAIIEASEKLFCQKGYLETTVDDILQELKCSKGSFYHYFDSKLSVLMAICESKVQRNFDAYKKTRVTSTREKMNALLYHAQWFRPEEEDFVFLMLRLRAREECAVMEGVLRSAMRETFKQELGDLMMILNETGAAHVSRIGLENLVFEVFTAFYDEMCETILECVRTGVSVADPLTEVVSAARFLWERTLDMDYGSVEIVKLEEAIPMMERVASRLRLV